MDKQQLKEAVGELNLVDTVFEADGVSYIDTAVSVMQVYDLIDQLDEPEVLSQELPVIPKFVGNWITKHREKFDLYPALRTLENNTLVWGSIYEWYRMNTHKFVNAYLTGEYEVENEPKYNVQLKPKSSSGMIGLFLFKLGDEVLAGDNFKAYYPEDDKFRLTEQEIKDFDLRYWAFRKPVEEMEE